MKHLRQRRHSTERTLSRSIGFLSHVLGVSDTSVRVFCVSDRRMRVLGTHYPKPHSPVYDVLAFPVGLPLPGQVQPERTLGEIYINAQLYANTPEYMMFLCIHGFLHLLGYRHEAKHDTIAMEKMERFLWLRALSSAWI